MISHWELEKTAKYVWKYVYIYHYDVDDILKYNILKTDRLDSNHSTTQSNSEDQFAAAIAA